MIAVVDLETTGLDTNQCEAISLGSQIINYDYDKGRWTLTFDTFYETGNISSLARIEETALDINGFSYGELYSQSQENTDMYKHFYQWCKEKKVTDLAGLNIGSFDIQFLKTLHNKTFNLGTSKTKWPFGHRYIEIGSIYFATTNRKSIQPYGFKEMCDFLDIENYKLHNALQDSIAEAKILCMTLNEEFSGGFNERKKRNKELFG